MDYVKSTNLLSDFNIKCDMVFRI